jgi:hypothetical protein
MGMEGKLRQVSEFELASYRKNPARLYSDFMGDHNLLALTEMNKAISAIMESALARRIRERALSEAEPDPEDVAEMQRQMQAAMSRNPRAAEQIESVMGLSKDGSRLSLYKDWHILHYLLTGKSWEPVSSSVDSAIMGGTEIPDVQGVMGYGPVRYLSTTQVREVAEALSQVPIEQRIESFNPQAAEAAEVYSANFGKDEFGEDDKDGLLRYFHLLRDFYRDAAAKGNAMLLWVD